jgi:hypothetical protein
MRLRGRDHTYRAIRVESRRWELRVDGSLHSSHDGFRNAEQAAAAIDRRDRKRRAVVRHTLILVGAFLVLTPVLVFREVANPAHAPAREFADHLETAYRAINAGEAEITDFSLGSDGIQGGLFEVDRGGVVADYSVLTGEHEGDCYVVRWRQGRVPFVARLLPRHPCAPGDPALSFDPAGFEALGHNTNLDGPLEWGRVLPAEVQTATWVLPAVIALLYVVLQQTVSLSLVSIRGVPARRVNVERIDESAEDQAPH